MGLFDRQITAIENAQQAAGLPTTSHPTNEVQVVDVSSPTAAKAVSMLIYTVVFALIAYTLGAFFAGLFGVAQNAELWATCSGSFVVAFGLVRTAKYLAK